jgi:hypothetical protein
MRALLIAAILFSAVAPAYAGGPNLDQKVDETKSPERQAEQDRAYKSSLQRIPAKAGNIDPWGDVKGNAPADPGAPSQTRAKKTQPATPAQ